MIQLLLPIAQYIVRWALDKSTIDDEIEDAIVVILFSILEKAAKATKTDVDDELVMALKNAMKPGEPIMVTVDDLPEEETNT